MRLFSQGQLEQIYQAALRVLADMGMKVENRQCLEAMENFGATVDFPAERALMSGEVMDRMLSIVKKEHGDWREARPQLNQTIGIGGGGTCPWYYDDETGEARRADEAACIQALKVVETSPVAATTPPVSNSDCPPKLEAIRILQLGIETLNHSSVGGTDLFYPEQMPFAVELGQLYKNDPTHFIPRGNCPTSPLTVGKTIADLAVAKAPYKVTYAVPTMPIAGANAPITPAGTAVIGVAEILGGYVLAKALDPETPVSATALSARMDLRTGDISYLAPEVFVADVAISEVFRVCLNLPCSVFGIYIDAKTPGMRAIYEKAMRSLALGLYGNISGFEGTLSQGKVFSNTQLMLDCDIYGMMAEYTQAPVVDKEALAVEDILSITWDSQGYLTSKHTMSHMRDAWQSALLAGDAGQEQEILRAARNAWKDNLRNYEPPGHSKEFLRDLRSIGNRAKEMLQ